MLVGSPLFILAILGLLLLVWLIRCLASPLRHVPGPPLSPFTSLGLRWRELGARRTAYIHRLHQQYGPIVRLAPDQVSFTSWPALKEIYCSGGSGYDKSDFYDMFKIFGRRTMFTMLNRADVSDGVVVLPLAERLTPGDQHAKRKRIIADRYSSSNVMRGLAIQGIQRRSRTFLRRCASASQSRTSDIFQVTSDDSIKTHHYPILHWLFARLLFWFAKPREVPLVDDYVLSATQGGDVAPFTLLNRLRDKSDLVDSTDMAAECLDHMVAGIDTTGDSLCFLMWELSQPRSLVFQRRLTDELRDKSGIPTEQLPFLDAVVCEALRCYPAIPMSLPRLVPPGGRFIDGVWLPAQTVVSCQPYSVHRINEDIFPEPDVFNPDRWLEPERDADRRRLLFAFSNGGRGCVGKQDLLRQLLDEAPQTSSIEPALNQSDFENLFGRVAESLASDGDASRSREAAKTHQFAIIETAARDVFDRLIASTPIESPEFVKMWHLLDILSLLSDNGQCDPALLFWLVEVLLDSQTIAGCRTIFDYLESRRERIMAKHFKQKNLVILRSCNELLRRLSRAEDTAFCGRVFIFMFQSFPLGDRSSVNLRGEFHVENVTNYEVSVPTAEGSKMDLDSQEAPKDSTDAKAATKTAASGASKAQKAFDPDSLYVSFWSLQESFSQPLKLFEPEHLARFKSNLEATVKAFQATHNNDGPHASKSTDGAKRDSRRKKEEDAADDGPETFNPKYLTSRDLFELEISDLSLRRHVLVQALIIIDFVLSLSPAAKEKLAGANASNKSVMYNDGFDDENIKWANDMKATISDYLKRGSDGPYFYRMVETVLARDKNWVSWKMASCPPIQREPVSWQTFNEAKENAQRLATTKRLRPTPLNAVNMDFIREDHFSRNLDLRRDPARYQLPDLNSFKQGIADDDFEIATAKDEETRSLATARKASKTWRALRLASTFKLAAFDKIDDDDDISRLFDDLPDSDDEVDEVGSWDEADLPDNRDPVVIAAAPGVDAESLTGLLAHHSRGFLAPVVRHAAREAREGEVNGRDFHFVAKLDFNQLRDGDRFIEYGESEGVDYGTSFSAVDAAVETGKVPLIVLNVESAQFARDMDFAARYVYVTHAQDEPIAGSYDKVMVASDPMQVVDGMMAYVFGMERYPDEADGDASMADAQTERPVGEDADDA
ncbi:hypothetical protein L249_7948 [Ophiocordyceps polyrhachis-furcata BCC 54312]|uniref:Guanylate kinase-like domain-containing protein n=1 Tax=Ophiocordyceps polyrhachis-furcata BCC 54312 TaxID=1330021 RepID=A0A367LH64_9HYPO|nr:hypothetical protein L249_7948 [Ophiocordyceps polyrhachis-furcata BCC 54312]